ncbi:MAG: tetratricopeptide repeat protein [Planctomycetes bacterium]|nr:tetratricopeptide repeat protein [Planctomycetota bacterium]
MKQRSAFLGPLLILAACASEPPAPPPQPSAADRARAAEGAAIAAQLVAENEIEKANEVADTVLELDPYAASSHLAAARAGSRRGVAELDPRVYEEAVRHATLACEADPENAEPFYVRAKLQFDRMHYSRALVDLRRVLELDPAQLEALQLAAWSHHSLNEPRAERAAWEALLAVSASDARATFRLAELLLASAEREDKKRGQELLVKAVELGPEDDLALQGLARLRAEQGDAAQAEELLRRALAAAAASGVPLRHGDIMFSLGAVVQQQGRLEEARDLYEQCLALEPDHDDHRALGNLGFVLIELGEKAEGRRYLEQALEQETNKRVRRRIEDVLKQLEEKRAENEQSGEAKGP